MFITKLRLIFVIVIIVDDVVAICPSACICTEPRVGVVKRPLSEDTVDDFDADSVEPKSIDNIDHLSNNTDHEKSITIGANCAGANLTNFPILLNPRTRTLILTGNRISALNLDELSVYPDLEYLDLSGNRILSIEQGAFFRLQKLKVLKLDGNLLTSLATETFAGLSELKVLDLSRNSLGRLATSIFSDLPRLESLNLSLNSIASIANGALINLRSIKSIDLSFNQIRRLPTAIFRSIESIRSLNLASNRIEALDDFSLRRLTELEELDLSSNNLDTVSDDAFIDLTNLRRFDLSDNKLQRMPTMSFRHLTELQSLDVSANLFGEVPTSAFEGLSRLKVLSISRCPNLQCTRLNSFSGLYDLHTLSMCDNHHLTELHPSSFEQERRKTLEIVLLSDRDSEVPAEDPRLEDPVPPHAHETFSLRRLYLRNNALQSLPEMLVPFEKLTQLDVRDNPWQCDCSLRFVGPLLQNMADKDGFLVENPPKCAEPAGVRGKPLLSLNQYQFGDCGLYSDFDWLLTLGAAILALSLLTAIILCVARHSQRIAIACCNKDSRSKLYASSASSDSSGSCRYDKRHYVLADPFLDAVPTSRDSCCGRTTGNGQFYVHENLCSTGFIIRENVCKIADGAQFDTDDVILDDVTVATAAPLYGNTEKTFGDTYCMYEKPQFSIVTPTMSVKRCETVKRENGNRTSDYYSGTSCSYMPVAVRQASGPVRQCSWRPVDRTASFKIVQTYPIPITEV